MIHCADEIVIPGFFVVMFIVLIVLVVAVEQIQGSIKREFLDKFLGRGSQCVASAHAVILSTNGRQDMATLIVERNSELVCNS